MSNPKKGESLLSFVILAPLLIGLSTAIAYWLITLAIQSFLTLDTFTIARAHLYGNNLDVCTPSRYWPRSLKVKISCKNTEVNGEVFWGEKLLAHRQVIWRAR